MNFQAGIGYSKPDPVSFRTILSSGFRSGWVLRSPSLTRPLQSDRGSLPAWTSVKVSGGGVQNRNQFGLGGGVELNLLNGFGLHAAYDRLFRWRRSERLRSRGTLCLPDSRIVNPRRSPVGISILDLPTLLLVGTLSGCSQTFDAATLGVPTSMASPAEQPPEGSNFRVTSQALFGFWGVAKIKEPSLRKALAAQLAGGSAVGELRIRCTAAFPTCWSRF